MVIYYYRRNSINKAVNLEQPGQAFLGTNLFSKYGQEVIYHDQEWSNTFRQRLVRNLDNLKRLYFPEQSYDVLYATSHWGIELIMLLRALKLFRKPIVAIRYAGIRIPKNRLLRSLVTLFYKGADKMIIASEKSYEETRLSGLVASEKLSFISIGPDLAYYDRLYNALKNDKTELAFPEFISTGREHRDFNTLVDAFSEAGKSLILYTTLRHGDNNHKRFFKEKGPLKENIQLNMLEKTVPAKELALKIIRSGCVVCCLEKVNYNAGVSSLQEAVGLGIPIITTDSPYFDIDVELEGMGLKVGYEDVDGWIKAIEYLSENKDLAKQMGEAARRYAEKEWNLELSVQKIVDVFLSL
jgi:glycosyltransferase involved in cell wall biosynthesis